MPPILQNSEDRGKFVQLGHAVSAGALKTHDYNAVRPATRFKFLLQRVLIVNYHGLSTHLTMLGFDRGYLDDAAPRLPVRVVTPFLVEG